MEARNTEDGHRSKRRRMRAEGENSNSNGTPRQVSNGSGASPLHKTALSNSANGTRRSPAAMSGLLNTNGHSDLGSKARPGYFGHDREEVSRILIQALTDLGYNGAAASLSQESGYDLESPAVAAFRNAVLQGEWDEAEELLFGVSTEEGGVSISGNGLVLQDGVDKNVMRFWLRQQKFLELLEQRDTGRALMVLRSELTPLYQDTIKLHFLSRYGCTDFSENLQCVKSKEGSLLTQHSLLMCQSVDDLKVKAAWDGAEGESRHLLLSDLSRKSSNPNHRPIMTILECISPSVMLPEHRLAVLLTQVKRSQVSNCLYHNTVASPSLYQDHSCDRNNFPVWPFLYLEKHSGEVWQVVFSHDGTRLASSGSDGVVIIYDVGSFEVLHTLSDHESAVCSISWSPDDSFIVSGSTDKRARLWNALASHQINFQIPY